MLHVRAGLALIVVMFTMAGCGKKEQPRPAAPPPVPKVYHYTNRVEVVQEKKIPYKPGRRIVAEADFDRDGKPDRAVVTSVRIPPEERAPAREGGPPVAVSKDAVVIYIQQAMGSYYVGGRIAREKPGEVIGLMIRDGDEYDDLVMTIKNTSGSTEVVQYRNDGHSFEEVAGPLDEGSIEIGPIPGEQGK